MGVPGSGALQTLGCPSRGAAGLGGEEDRGPGLRHPAVRGGGGRSAKSGGVFHSPPPLMSSFPCPGLSAVVLLALKPLPQNFFVDFETSRKIHREVTTAEWTELTPVVKPCPLLALP